MVSETAFLISTGAGVFGLVGWLLYFRERGRSRDYVTDLLQLVHDHNLGRDDVDGIMTILDEELSPLDHLVEEWACDRCGENKSTARKGDEHLCNSCIFGKEEA